MPGCMGRGLGGGLGGYHRVPTGTGKPGKHGKWLKMEKSWNLKNDEISWNNHGILL